MGPLRQALSHDTSADILVELGAFIVHLRAEIKAPSTIKSSDRAVRQLDAYLAEAAMPRLVAIIRREHVEAFLVGFQERGMKPATVAQNFRSLRQSFKWLSIEGDIPSTRWR